MTDLAEWELQKETLKDFYYIEGLQPIEVYYDIEMDRGLDPRIIIVSAIILILTKISEHIISDTYKLLKEKLKKIFNMRKRSSKLAFNITIVLQQRDTIFILQRNIKNDREIDQLIDEFKIVYDKIQKGIDININKIDKSKLNVLLSNLPKVEI